MQRLGGSEAEKKTMELVTPPRRDEKSGAVPRTSLRDPAVRERVGDAAQRNSIIGIFSAAQEVLASKKKVRTRTSSGFAQRATVCRRDARRCNQTRSWTIWSTLIPTVRCTRIPVSGLLSAIDAALSELPLDAFERSFQLSARDTESEGG